MKTNTQIKKIFLKNNIKAIIFDFDDTLVDEMHWLESRWKKTIIYAEKELHLAKFGKYFWEIFKRKGSKYKYHVNDTLKKLNKSQELIKPIVHDFSSQETNEILIKASVRCLKFLKKRYKLGIITNGRRKTQIKRIKKARIYDYFDAIVCAYENPKPQKKPFDECLKKLNVKANEAIYISHDIEMDIIGAKKAGMFTIYFNPKKDTCNIKPKEVDIMIKSYKELNKKLKIIKEDKE